MKIQKVKPTFISQKNAKARTYLYRLAVANENKDVQRGEDNKKENNLKTIQLMSPFETPFTTTIKYF